MTRARASQLSVFVNKLFLIAFLGPHLRHMKVPWLGVESELQLLAYATATASQDLSCISDLHHSSVCVCVCVCV